MSRKLDSITDAIEDIKAGKVIIVVDDEDRENEGDFLSRGRKSHSRNELISWPRMEED